MFVSFLSPIGEIVELNFWEAYLIVNVCKKISHSNKMNVQKDGL